MAKIKAPSRDQIVADLVAAGYTRRDAAAAADAMVADYDLVTLDGDGREVETEHESLFDERTDQS